jgi:hypothetical protein
MSSLWTPDGERPISRTPSAPTATPSSAPPTARRSPGDRPDDLPNPEEMAAMQEELAAMSAEIAQVPAHAVIANHVVGLFQLAAVHLQIDPPNFGDATLAIDAMAAVVDRLKGRLGPDESTLVDALSQIRMAFVQVTNEVNRKA